MVNLSTLSRSLILILTGVGFAVGFPDEIGAKEHQQVKGLEAYVGNWELFSAEEDQGLDYQGGVLMEESNERLMGLVFLELGQGLVGMMELEPQMERQFAGHIWMFNLQLKPAEQKSILIPVTAIASEEEQPYLQLNLEPDGVLLKEELKILASLLTPEVEAQRQAQTNLHYMNLSQEVYFEQFQAFNQDIESLTYLLGEDQFYQYSLQGIGDDQVQAIAMPVQDNLRAYTGAVFSLGNQEFAAVRCEAEVRGTMEQVPAPTLVKGESVCPTGFKKIL
jgi:hypothetical protein